ncbi:MAG: DegT/DnrJ/EryC1/StrS family aminotransferase, partial [Candidatus Eremiobacterota bacterium]
MIPILELSTQYKAIGKELEEAALRALASTHYILGPETVAFEKEFAEYNGAAFGIGVANGTDALQLAVRALGLGPGDEVLCPSFTFMATAGAVALTGARPVFVDIDPVSFCVDPADVARRITDRTRAMVVVHLYGNAAPMDELMALARKHNLSVIEDCAQAAGCTFNGRKVGTIGDFGCFSFFPSKNLGGIGDGGMVLAMNSDLADRVKKLRSHGSSKKYVHEILGTNSRLDEIQAAVLRVKLRYLDGWNEKRRAVAVEYDRLLADVVTVPRPTTGAFHVYHQYTIRSQRQ